MEAEEVTIHIPRASSLDISFSRSAWDLLTEEQRDDVVRTMATNFYHKHLKWKVVEDGN